jgi:hypothetical protein
VRVGWDGLADVFPGAGHVGAVIHVDLGIGSAANVSQQLGRRAAAAPRAKLPSSPQEWIHSVKK